MHRVCGDDPGEGVARDKHSHCLTLGGALHNISCGVAVDSSHEAGEVMKVHLACIGKWGLKL